MAAFEFDPSTAKPDGEFDATSAKPYTPPKSGLIRRGIGDTALAFGQGAVGAVKAITDTTGAGTRVSKGLGDLTQGMQGLMSPERQAEMAERQAKVEAADASGNTLDQVTSRLGGFVEAPVQTLAQGAGSILPTVAAAVATRGKTLPALAVGGAMGVGGVKGQNYDAVLNEAQARGLPQAEAEALAEKASEYSRENATQQVLGGALGALAGTTGVERIARGAVGAGQGVIKRVARGAIGEGLPEGAQGAQQQFAQNEALNNAGFTTDPMAGVVGQGVFDAAVGGALGGVAGVPRPRSIDALPAAPGQPAPAAAPAPAVTAPAATPGDAIRATAPPVTGPLTGALAAGTEATAQAADAGIAALPVGQAQELTGNPAALMRQGLTPEQIASRGAQQIELDRFRFQNSQGIDTLSAGVLDPGVDARELSLAEAAALTARPVEQTGRIPTGRATELPVDTAEPTAAGLTPTLPEVRREPRTPKPQATRGMTDADVVAAYVEQRRTEGTLAGRRFAGDFDAGRITPADVLALAQPRTEPTPDERLAAAAAQAPAPAGGLELPRAAAQPDGITVERTSARRGAASTAAARAPKPAAAPRPRIGGETLARRRLVSLADNFSKQGTPNGKTFAAVLRSYVQDLDAGKLTPEQVAPQVQRYTELLRSSRQSPAEGVSAPKESTNGNQALRTQEPEQAGTQPVRAQDDAEAGAPRSLKDQPRAAFEHAGLKVYPGRVRVGDTVEDRWAVQLPENKATGKVLGDTLHTTRQEAMKAAEREAARFAREQRDRAEQDAAETARKTEEASRKAANRGKSLVERRADATLDRETSENGERMTRRQWVERKLSEGLVPRITQEDKLKPLTRAQFNRATNEEQRAHDRKVKAAGKKDVYWIGDYEVTKTEYDYAQERRSAPAVNPPEAPPGEAPTPRAGAAAATAPAGVPGAASPGVEAGGLKRDLPPLPVAQYRVERRYANGAVIRPLPGKSFSDDEVRQIADWFRAAKWEVSTAAPSGISAVNNANMSADDIPEPYTAAQRKRDEAAREVESKAKAKAADQASYMAASPAATFISDKFGDSLNGFNSAALARFLDGTDAAFGGLLSNRAADALEAMGIAAEGRATKDILADVKARYQATQAAPASDQQVPAATHKDPGEPAEPVTPAVVKDAIKKGVQATDRKPSAMKAELLAEIDQAVQDAPDYPEFQALVKSMGQKDAAAVMMARGEKGAPAGYSRPKRTFKVEGDGVFTVQNSVRQLLTFRDKVEKSPGFRDRQPSAGLNERATDALDRRSTDAAIANMIDEGDFQAALDFAESKDVDIANVKLTKVLRERLDKWQKDQESARRLAEYQAAQAEGQPAPGSLAAMMAEQEQAAPAAEPEPDDIPEAGIASQTFEQWAKAKYAGNEYRAKYLEEFGGNEQRATLAAAIGTIDNDRATADLLRAAKQQYRSDLFQLPRETSISLDVWDALDNMAKVEAQRHFYDLDARITRRDQDATKARVEAERIKKAPYEAAFAEVDAEIRRLDKIDGPVTQKQKDLSARRDRLREAIYQIGQGKEPDGRLLRKVDEPEPLDLMGFERAPKGNGAFDLRDGNMLVRVEPTGRGTYRASMGSGKSGPNLTEQQAVEWAAATRAESQRVQAADAKKAKRPPAAPTPDPFADDYSALVGKTIEQTVTTDDGKTATLRMDAARALRAFDRREKTLADLKTCLGRNS